MTFKEMKQVVFAEKPGFGKIIEAHGNETLFSYWQKNLISPNTLYADRHEKLSTGIAEIAKDRLGERGYALAIECLQANSFISTADHHHLLCHPFFVNSTLLQSLVHQSQGLKTVITLGCAGISLDNSSFPRGLFYHDERLTEERLRFFTLKHRRMPVYGLPAYEEKNLQDEDLEKILERIYFRKEILERTKYRDQATIANYFAWKQIPGQEQTNLIYIDQESVAVKLLGSLLKTENVITKILTTPAGLDAFQNHFRDMTGSFTTSGDKGTFLFWAIKNGRRERLIRDGKSLIIKGGSLRIPLTPESLMQALSEETIYPSMALTLSILSFYYGLTLGGGFSQVEYLSQMKDAYIKVLRDIAETNEIKKVETVATNHFSGDVVLATVGRNGKRTPATLIDLIMYKNQGMKAGIQKHAKTLLLGDAILPLLPECYKIITGAWPNKIPKIRLPHPVCRARHKPVCLYCGNSPTNHTFEWIGQTMTILRSPFDRMIAKSWFGRFAAYLAERIQVPLFAIFRLLRMTTYNVGDVSTAVTERSRLIWREAIKRNIPIKQVVMLDRATEHFIAEINNKTIVYESLPRPRHLETDSIFWLDDKLVLKRTFEKAGIPVPKGGSFSSWDDIKRAFVNMTKPVIVKPRLGSRGRHTTTRIYTETELKEAVRIAKQLCYYVIVEEHLHGSIYRGTVVGGKVAGILEGDQPRVTGDGISTIAELIEQKNKTKPERVKDVIINDGIIDFLARTGNTLESIIPAGITINVSEKVGPPYGGSTKELLPVTHPKLIEIIERAGKTVNDPVIGFDFIIQDPTKDPDTQKWGIIEANSLPFINLHYEPLEGPSIDVAPYVWDLWKKN